GVINVVSLVVLLGVMLAVVAGVAMMTVAQRKIPIQIPRKVMGRGRMREGQKTFIPIRINSASVMPIIFAQSLIIVPGTIATFSTLPSLKALADFVAPGTMPYYVLYAVMIVF